MDSNVDRLRLVAVALLLATSLACGGGDEPAPAGEELPPAAATPAPAAPTPPAPPQERLPLVVSESLPLGFPTDVPTHPDAKVEFSRSSGDMIITMRQHVPGSAEDTLSFYSDGFASEGWSTEVITMDDGSKMIVADKENRKTAVRIAEGDGESVVELVVSKLAM